MLFFSLVQIEILNRVKEHNRVFHMSPYQFIYAGGIILGPIGGSFIYHYFSADILWWLCGALGLTAAIMCLSGDTRR